MYFYYHLSFNHFHILALLESLFPFWENFKILPLASYQASTLVLSHSVVSDSLRPHGLKPTRLLWPWGFSRQEYWSRLPCPPPEDLPNPGTEPRSPALQVDSLPSELPGKPKNTGVGILSLLQGIFLTQKSNQGPPNYRQILYQLSYQGNSLFCILIPAQFMEYLYYGQGFLSN